MKLILGTVQFGLDYGIYNPDGQTPVSEVYKILDFAYENGINVLDTAFIYGESEKIIGEYLKTNPNKSWKIISKSPPINYGLNIEKYYFQSKSKIGNSLDVYLAHDVQQFLRSKAVRNSFYGLKENGHVKKIGVSVYSQQEILDVLDHSNVDIIQLPLNVLDHRLIKLDILKRIKQCGIEIHIRSIFLQGLIFLSQEDLFVKFPDAIAPINTLKEIANANSLTIGELALLFVNSFPEVDKIVVGVNNLNQLKKNVFSLSKGYSKKISDRILNEIDYRNENVLNPVLWKY